MGRRASLLLRAGLAVVGVGRDPRPATSPDDMQTQDVPTPSLDRDTRADTEHLSVRVVDVRLQPAVRVTEDQDVTGDHQPLASLAGAVALRSERWRVVARGPMVRQKLAHRARAGLTLRDSRLPQRGAGSCPGQQSRSGRRRRRSTRSPRNRSRMRRDRSGRSGCRPRAGRRGNRGCRACRGRAERGEEEDRPRPERAERLLEAEVASLIAEAPGANELEAVRRREPVDTGVDPLGRVGDHEDLVGGRDVDRDRAAARSRIAASIETGTGRGEKTRIEPRLRRMVSSGEQGPDPLVESATPARRLRSGGLQNVTPRCPSGAAFAAPAACSSSPSSAWSRKK
jgi:hypothetical protein